MKWLKDQYRGIRYWFYVKKIQRTILKFQKAMNDMIIKTGVLNYVTVELSTSMHKFNETTSKIDWDRV